MHPGFCPVCSDVFDQVHCIPCRIACGHVSCQTCCETLVEGGKCCPLRCDPAILRPRDIRPISMSLVTDSESFTEGIVRSKVLATWSNIRSAQIQYNQNNSAVHSLRAEILIQKDSIPKYAKIVNKGIQTRKDLFQKLARARTDYEVELSNQSRLRDQLAQLRRALRTTAALPETPLSGSSLIGIKRYRVDDEVGEEPDAFQRRKVRDLPYLASNPD